MDTLNLKKTSVLSPLGTLILVSNTQELVGVYFENQKYFPAAFLVQVQEDSKDKVLQETKKWLQRYFQGQKPNPKELPLNPQGTPFQQHVWASLLKIPYGTTTTYGALAKQVAQLEGKDTFSSQAVGQAVGHNPISIIIPCHRVVGARDQLTGYAGGIERKKQLLQLEGGEKKWK